MIRFRHHEERSSDTEKEPGESPGSLTMIAPHIEYPVVAAGSATCAPFILLLVVIVGELATQLGPDQADCISVCIDLVSHPCDCLRLRKCERL